MLLSTPQEIGLCLLLVRDFKNPGAASTQLQSRGVSFTR
jgi:hypothetical protein